MTNVVPPQILFLLKYLSLKSKAHPSFTCDDHCKFSMCFGLTSIKPATEASSEVLFVCLFFCFFLCVFRLVVVQILGDFFCSLLPTLAGFASFRVFGH